MSTYRTPQVGAKRPSPVDLGFYCDIRFDADDSAPVYIGMHVTSGAAESDLEWKILKFSYSGTAVTRIQTAYGSWTDRGSLF